MPGHGPTSHGTASTSTKLSASSLRHTNELHSGRSPALNRPDQQPLGGDRHDAGDHAARRAAARRRAAPRPPKPTRPASRSKAASDEHGERHACTSTGTIRHSSTAARAHFSRARRVEGAALVALLGRPAAASSAACPSQELPALARFGRRRQHADQAVAWAPSGRGAVIPELPRKARLPIRASAIRSQPPPSSYGATIVSSARNAPSPTVVIAGSASTVDSLDAAADLHAERPQPDGREQAGVQREQPHPGHVHQPLGRPRLPGDPAVHRVVARAQADAEQPHADQDDQRVAWPSRRPSRAARRSARGAAPRRASRAPRTTGRAPRAPGSARERGQQAEHQRGQRRTPATQRRVRGGRPLGRRCAALPVRGGGHARPALARPGPRPVTPEPGAISARLPIRAPGKQRAAGADRGARADPDLADVQPVAVEPVPGQIDLGLDRAALAQLEHAGHRRQRSAGRRPRRPGRRAPGRSR